MTPAVFSLLAFALAARGEDLLEAELSHMPNLYEDSSENELRLAGSVALSKRASFDATFEYSPKLKPTLSVLDIPSDSVDGNDPGFTSSSPF